MFLWVGGENVCSTVYQSTITIVSFDMSSEVIQASRTFPNPCKYYGSVDAAVVFMLKDETIALFHCQNRFPSGDLERSFEIWVLQQYGQTVGECWCKLFSFSPPLGTMRRPKGLSKDGEVIFNSNGDQLLVLDPITGKMYTLPVEERCFSVTMETYTPSTRPLIEGETKQKSNNLGNNNLELTTTGGFCAC
ncbi:unnamed protein product [Linum trigynum]|uniref:F-box associated domain-containing protein n=1 Tax=Linum trigynum TaxID=586398 RepID=A0AAV2F191_9ROSI